MSNIASFLKDWREVLTGAMLCLNNIEWLALLVRSNLIMSAQKKFNIWDTQMQQKVLRTESKDISFVWIMWIWRNVEKFKFWNLKILQNLKIWSSLGQRRNSRIQDYAPSFDMLTNGIFHKNKCFLDTGLSSYIKSKCSNENFENMQKFENWNFSKISRIHLQLVAFLFKLQ